MMTPRRLADPRAPLPAFPAANSMAPARRPSVGCQMDDANSERV